MSGDVTALLLTTTPPSLLWAGREAVLLFFVLSGFVLALGFERPAADRPHWRSFAAKRTLRLILPCAVVAIATAVLVAATGPAPLPELSAWVNGSWMEPPTPWRVLQHALLLGGDYTLNNPMWTLHYELRVSLLFPLLMLIVAMGGPVLAAAIAGGVLLCLLEMKVVGSGALTLLLFLPHFALGALLARHRTPLVAWVGRQGRARRAGLWLGCYLLLTFRWLVPAGGLACDLANGAGGGMLIILVLGSPRLARALELRPVAWLGGISYSLYLLHVPVLLAGLHLAPDVAPWVVAVLAPVASVAAAAAMHRLVEAPSIRLGRQAAAWIDRRRAPPALAAASR
jgi:peptidoglycan/LPS O-acetylase OafA/YrhL